MLIEHSGVSDMEISYEISRRDLLTRGKIRQSNGLSSYLVKSDAIYSIKNEVH